MTWFSRLHDYLKLPRRWLFRDKWLWVLIIICSVMGESGQSAIVRQGNIIVETSGDMPRYTDTVLSLATAALRALNERAGDSLLVPVTFVVAENERRFRELSGGEGENTLAVAYGKQQRVIINYQAITRTGADKTLQILVHELAHVYLEVKCLEQVPHWIHEGVAQKLAWETDEGMSIGRLAMAAYIGGLIPLRELVDSFPADQDSRTKAYAEALSAVEFLVERDYDGSLSTFLAAIRGESGRETLRRLSDRVYVEEFDQQWRDSLRSPLYLVTLVLGSGFFWGVSACLLVVAYFIKRKRSQALRVQWLEEEDRADESVIDQVERFDEDVITGMDENYTPEETFGEETPFDRYLAEKETLNEDEDWKS